MKHRLLFALALMVFAAAHCLADTPSGEGITVAGTAEVKGNPTEVQIDAMVTGEAELTADALVKYRDARKRAVAAIEAMKMPNLTISYNGVSITQAVDPNAQQMMMQGRGGAAAKSKVQAAESVRLVLKDIDKMPTEKLLDVVMKVVDAGRDAGLQIGPSTPQNYYQYQMAMQNGQGQGLMQFKIPDPKEQREKAYKQAMDDAKAKAQRLAELAGVKLGRIIAVRESGAPHINNPYPWMEQNNGGEQTDASELTSQTLTELPLKVTLLVQFEIAK